jgi:outer membrane receptor for ferrienterochelin and colicins
MTRRSRKNFSIPYKPLFVRTNDRTALRLARRIALIAMLSGLLPASATRAQLSSVVGAVTDSAGTPLIGANIMVKGTVLGAASDMAGRFEIRKIPAGEHVLAVTMLGFLRTEIPFTAQPGEVHTARILLRENPILTDEVVVTAGRRGQSFEEIPVSIALLERQQIEQRTLTSLDQALRYMPGVNITETQINIRGSSGYSRALGSRVLLLLDGVPLLAGDANEVKFDAVPMYMIDRIEVVKGAGSALYGSSALGGVINVITREPEKATTRLRVYSGFFGNPLHEEWKWWANGPRLFHGIDAQHANAYNDLRYLVSFGARSQQSYRQKDDFLRFNANAKAGWKISPERQLSATVNYASDLHGNWVYWRDLNHAFMAPPRSDLGERLFSTKLQGTLQYRETVSASFSHFVRVYGYRTEYDMSSDTSDFHFRPTDRTQSRAVVLGAEWQGTMSLMPNYTIVGGVDATHTDVVSRTFGDRWGYSAAAYLQQDYRPVDRVNISAGLRFDASKVVMGETEAELTPRLGVSWAPLHGTILRSSLGWGFRAASIAERFATASAGGLLTKPNPELRSERSTSYEIGLKQELFPVVIDLAYFVNNYDNLVEPILDPADGKIVFRNITRARIEGVECSLLASPWPRHLDLSLGYTYMNPRDLVLNDILKYRPKHLLYASGVATCGPASLGVDFRFIARIETIDRELELIINDADQRVPIYVTDARFSWDFAAQGIPLNAIVSVENLFQYNYTEIVGNIAPIRNFKLTLESSF